MDKPASLRRRSIVLGFVPGVLLAGTALPLTAALPVSPSRYVEALVDQYLAGHPGYEFPDWTRHPSAIAWGDSVGMWLTDRLGGYEDYLRAMVAAGREWFPVGVDSGEFRVHCYEFERIGNLGCEHPWYLDLCKNYHAWRKRKRSLES